MSESQPNTPARAFEAAGRSSAVIRFAGVSKRFGEQEVLRAVDFSVQRGTVHFLVGPSGVGKSVAIKQLVGLLRPDDGRIEIDGRDVTHLSEQEFLAVRRQCQMIFQNATLFGSMTVMENVAMPIRKRFVVSRLEAENRARRVLQLVRVEQLADRLPGVLGLGVCKRVAIARALALEPDILLYDEPTTGLDPVAARRTDRLIQEMAHRFALTAVVVSHDLESVRTIGDWVTFLHEGRVCFDGPPADFFASQKDEVCSFIHCGRAHPRPAGSAS